MVPTELEIRFNSKPATRSNACDTKAGVTNLFAIAGYFVSYRWVSGPHKFLVILWNVLKTKKSVHQQKQTTNESNNCLSRLNASWAARNSFVGRMFVTSALRHTQQGNIATWTKIVAIFTQAFWLIVDDVKNWTITSDVTRGGFCAQAANWNF